MAKLALHQGAYEARSPIANAQIAINIYAEGNPPDAPFPVTMYPAPGLNVLSDYTGGALSGAVRGLYQTSTGWIVAVVGESVITWVAPGNGAASLVSQGTIPSNTGQPVSI